MSANEENRSKLLDESRNLRATQAGVTMKEEVYAKVYAKCGNSSDASARMSKCPSVSCQDGKVWKI
jgi:hypothetical protein